MPKKRKSKKDRKGKAAQKQYRRQLLLTAGAIVAVVLVYAAYVHVFVRADEGLEALFARLEAQGFTPNEGFSPLYEPGTILQVTEDDGHGGERPLATPLRLVRAADCFPESVPDDRPFALPAATGTSQASLHLLGRLLATVGLDSGAVARYRVDPGEARILSFTKDDLSQRFSRRCVDALERARAQGDPLEWYGIVIEVVVSDGLRVEMEWTRDAAADVKREVQKGARQTLAAGLSELGLGAGDEDQTVIEATGRVVLGYRVRPLGRTEIEVTDGRAPASPRLASFPSPPQDGNEPRAERTPEAPEGALLRGAFVDDGKASPEDASGDRVVGRLALLLVEGDRERQVGLDHGFRSGDRFRFEVTSSVRGWLYVLHQAPDAEEAELLWPPDEAANLVEARKTSVIPPSPAAFRFDEDLGEESFYVAVHSAPDTGSTALRQKAVAEPEARKEVQYFVRGLGEEPNQRGVLYDPGPQDADHHVYFAPSEEDGTVAVVEFQLRHE